MGGLETRRLGCVDTGARKGVRQNRDCILRSTVRNGMGGGKGETTTEGEGARDKKKRARSREAGKRWNERRA